MLLCESLTISMRKLKHLSNVNMFWDVYDTYLLIFLLPVNYTEHYKHSDMIEQLHSGIHYYKNRLHIEACKNERLRAGEGEKKFTNNV